MMGEQARGPLKPARTSAIQRSCNRPACKGMPPAMTVPEPSHAGVVAEQYATPSPGAATILSGCGADGGACVAARLQSAHCQAMIVERQQRLKDFRRSCMRRVSEKRDAERRTTNAVTSVVALGQAAEPQVKLVRALLEACGGDACEAFKRLDVHQTGELTMSELQAGLLRLHVDWRRATGEQNLGRVLRGVCRDDGVKAFSLSGLFGNCGSLGAPGEMEQCGHQLHLQSEILVPRLPSSCDAASAAQGGESDTFTGLAELGNLFRAVAIHRLNGIPFLPCFPTQTLVAEPCRSAQIHEALSSRPTQLRVELKGETTNERGGESPRHAQDSCSSVERVRDLHPECRGAEKAFTSPPGGLCMYGNWFASDPTNLSTQQSPSGARERRNEEDAATTKIQAMCRGASARARVRAWKQENDKENSLDWKTAKAVYLEARNRPLPDLHNHDIQMEILLGNECTEIVPRLFLAGDYNPQRVAHLNGAIKNAVPDLGFVVRCSEKPSKCLEANDVPLFAFEPKEDSEGRMYVGVHCFDLHAKNDLLRLKDCCIQIKAKLEQRCNVLVHCQQGVDRSATVAAAFCMAYFDISTTDARESLKRLRPACTEQMLEYEDFLRTNEHKIRRFFDLVQEFDAAEKVREDVEGVASRKFEGGSRARIEPKRTAVSPRADLDAFGSCEHEEGHGEFDAIRICEQEEAVYDEEGTSLSGGHGSDKGARYTAGLLNLLFRRYATRNRPPPDLCACVPRPAGPAPTITADGNFSQPLAWEAYVQRISTPSSHARNCEFASDIRAMRRQILVLYPQANVV